MDKSIQVEIAKLGDEIKKVVRRVDQLQKSVDLLFADRQIIEDVQGSIKHLQEIILVNQTHQDNAKKDLKADVKEVQNMVEAKIDEVKINQDENTLIVKSQKENIIDKVKNLIK